MRILQISTIYPSKRMPKQIGGAEISAAQISKQLVSLGHEVRVVRSAPRGSEMAIESFGDLELQSIISRNLYWPYDGRPRDPLSKIIWHMTEDQGYGKLKFNEILDEFLPNVILSHNISGISSKFIEVATSRNIPVVQVYHDYYFICSNNKMYYNDKDCDIRCAKCQFLTSKRRGRLKHVSMHVFISDFMRRVFMKDVPYINEINSLVIPNALDFAVSPSPKTFSDVTIGYLGRISAEKGIFELLSAVRKQDGKVKLLVAGDGNQSEIDRMLSLMPDFASYEGFIKKHELFDKINVLCVPSLWSEPFGRGVIEAQARGIPSICSDAGALPATQGGALYGWQFSKRDVASLSETIHSITKLDKAELVNMSERCLDRAKQFEPAALGKRYEDVLSRSLEFPGHGV